MIGQLAYPYNSSVTLDCESDSQSPLCNQYYICHITVLNSFPAVSTSLYFYIEVLFVCSLSKHTAKTNRPPASVYYAFLDLRIVR